MKLQIACRQIMRGQQSLLLKRQSMKLLFERDQSALVSVKKLPCLIEAQGRDGTFQFFQLRDSQKSSLFAFPEMILVVKLLLFIVSHDLIVL